MWRFFVNLFAILGLLGVLASVGIGVLIWRYAAAGPEHERFDAIALDLYEGPAEQEALAEPVFGSAGLVALN